MPQKYALLMNGFSETDVLVLMNGFSKTDNINGLELLNGFSKTDDPQGRGPPNRRTRIQVVTLWLRKNPKKLLDFLSLKK